MDAIHLFAKGNSNEMSTPFSDRAATSTKPQDLFIELFAQVFGLEKVQFLSPEHPFQDILGTPRFIDFALKTLDERIAFEIDGLSWHHPQAISVDQFEDGLLRDYLRSREIGGEPSDPGTG
jgi:hypothetical protein